MCERCEQTLMAESNESLHGQVLHLAQELASERAANTANISELHRADQRLGEILVDNELLKVKLAKLQEASSTVPESLKPKEFAIGQEVTWRGDPLGWARPWTVIGLGRQLALIKSGEREAAADLYELSHSGEKQMTTVEMLLADGLLKVIHSTLCGNTTLVEISVAVDEYLRKTKTEAEELRESLSAVQKDANWELDKRRALEAEVASLRKGSGVCDCGPLKENNIVAYCQFCGSRLP